MQQVEGDKRKAAAAAAQAAGGGWFGWFRGTPAAKPDESQEPAADGELSEEETQHLRQLVNEQEEALDVGELVVCCMLGIQGPIAQTCACGRGCSVSICNTWLK